MVRLLRLSRMKGAPGKRGLVMIQIDGLGDTQFECALRKGKLPFLAGLLKTQGYVKNALYSGVPSNTPVVQAKLFYGAQTSVPAFSFLDRQTGRVFTMFDSESVDAVEARLKEKGPPLLKNGGSYGNIFTGGASEAHFCAATLGWGDLLKAANPFTMSITILLNAHIFVRAFFLFMIELVLAILDYVRGILAGKNFKKELSFIGLRVGICILLREAVCAGAKIDIARGLPVIHLNLSGYDEQAHHRGPGSRFAYWSLKGIDQTIAGICRAARRSSSRDYDVWIYSDHGQEETLPYAEEHGRSVEEAITGVFKEKLSSDQWRMRYLNTAPYWRARLLRKKKKLPIPIPIPIPFNGANKKESEAPAVTVTAMGPLGHIYLPLEVTSAEKEKLARELVWSAKIPLVMAVMESGAVRAWTGEGRFDLPEEAARILGVDHPFLNDAARDLVDLCHHPDAGTFVISGWRKGRKPNNFEADSGAHAGPGPEETRGFVLLPAGALPLPAAGRDYVYPGDLRSAAQRFLESESEEDDSDLSRTIFKPEPVSLYASSRVAKRLK